MGIEFENVSHIYKGVTKNSDLVAIKDINLKIEKSKEFVAICGKTGSGKSTLINHMNALLLPTGGVIKIFDKCIIPKKKTKLKDIRKKVGLVFQFPEYQLFESTVLKDIMFGPLNFGAKEKEAIIMANNAAKLVGLDEKILAKSPFKLSGGQMRRVAIAGILAIDPDILVLDEPTRGLDPKGAKETMELFKHIHDEYDKTIVLITHDMNIVSKYAKRVIVMDNGEIVYDGAKENLFDNPNFDFFHLDVPDVIKAVDYLNNELNLNISRKTFSMEELIKKLKEEE